ncbi:MAG TPA: hypothetical protein VJN96_20845 [Vicinamibacterales bacterium]|nr:hypothetical protein [Vicinamibacterales bacterium]
MTLRRALLIFAFAVAFCGGRLSAGQTDPVMHLQGFGGTVEKFGFMGVQRFDPSMLVDVVITRFSTDDERAHFVATGIPGLGGMPIIGQVKVAGNPPYSIRYAARESSSSDSTLVTLVTDRVLVVGSARTSPACPVTIIRLAVEAKGHGSGYLSAAQTISYNPSTKRISGGCEDPDALLIQSLHQVVVEHTR